MVIKMIFLCIVGFSAALVDSIAGGGGLISLPAFLLAGVPADLSLGTNKFASTCASFTSSLKYARSGKVNFKILKFLVPFTLTGASLGVFVALHISNKYLSPMVLVLVLTVGLYTLLKKTIGQEDNYKGYDRRKIILGILLAFSTGFYDGFFGPGTGSFLMFGLISIFGFDFVKAGGNAKALNFVSNVTALTLFAFNRKIYYLYGIPVAIFMILGARFGTSLALRRGARFVKPIFVTMSLAVAVKMLVNLLNRGDFVKHIIASIIR